jgi:hypothetical protein
MLKEEKLCDKYTGKDCRGFIKQREAICEKTTEYHS